MTSETKTCRACGNEKPVEDFYRHRLVCKRCFNLSRYQHERKPKVFFNEIGQKRTGKSIYWSGNMISILKRYYPNTDTKEVAGMLNVSERTAYSKAKEMGLNKETGYIRSIKSMNGMIGGIKRNSKRK